MKRTGIRKLLGFLLTLSVALGIIYYKNSSYLLTLTYQPDEELINTFSKVDKVIIDNDGIEVLIFPCKNNVQLNIVEFEEADSDKYITLYNNDKMNVDEAVLLKINKDSPRLIDLMVSRNARKSTYTFIPLNKQIESPFVSKRF